MPCGYLGAGITGSQAADTRGSEELYYVDSGVIHTAVPNMPATVARTSSQSLSAAVLPYVMALADSDIHENKQITNQHAVSSRIKALLLAIAISHGEVVDRILRQEI